MKSGSITGGIEQIARRSPATQLWSLRLRGVSAKAGRRGYRKGEGELGADFTLFYPPRYTLLTSSLLSTNIGLLPSLRYQTFNLFNRSSTIPSVMFHNNINRSKFEHRFT
jgi:hypothetical protein